MRRSVPILAALAACALAPAAGAQTRDVLYVGNNWDGTADVVDPQRFERVARLNIIPDKDERLAEIAMDPASQGYFLGIRQLVGEGNDQYVDDMFSSHDGRFLYVSRPSFADVVGIDLADGEDHLAREGRGLPLRPHGDLPGRQARARLGLDGAQGPRHRRRAGQDRRRVRVRRPAAREQLLRSTATRSSTRRSARSSRRPTTRRSTPRRATAGSRSSTRGRTRCSSASTWARSSRRPATRT